MFYSSDLLIFKRGKFSLIWLAATRGEKYLSKKDLNMVDIYFVCSEIKDYVSQNHHIKLSLYLSSQLTFGLCVIYNKKIDRLLTDLQDLYKKALTSFNFNDNLFNKNKGRKKSKDKQNVNLSNISIDFCDFSSTFGMLNKLETNISLKENEMDLDNQVAYLNQARFEDITLIDYDIGTNNFRNQLENDLEPVNVELLQELLGAVDPLKNDLEHYLDTSRNASMEQNQLTERNDENNYYNTIVDLDKVDTVNIAQNPELLKNIHNNEQLVIDYNEISAIKTDYQQTENVLEISNLIPISSENQVLEICNINQNIIPTIKSSRSVDDLEVSFNENKKVDIFELSYKKPVKKTKKIPKAFKRRTATRSLIIDQVTTISHHVIRENINKKYFSMVGKDWLFPNQYVVNSLRGQIASSAVNLFEFPGTYTTLRCPKHLQFWMSCKEQLRGCKSSIFEHLSILKQTDQDKPIKDLSLNEVSIEKGRRASSFMNIGLDSFTVDSDNLQRSIRQSSFDADKTIVLENNEIIPENVEDHCNFSGEKSMMPIIEEDLIPRPEIKKALARKDDVWKSIHHIFEKELGTCQPWDEIRIPFSDICPTGFSKKVASMVFLTILRLGKYKKIKLYQETSLSEIFIGLPSKEQ